MKNGPEKEIRALETAAERLLDCAVKNGADRAEICATYSQQSKIALEKQDFHLASSDSGYQFGARVIKGDRQGFAACNGLSEGELKSTALKAVEIANFTPGNPYFSIRESEHVLKNAPMDSLWDDAVYDLSLQTQRQWTQIFYDELSKDKKFRLNEGNVSVGHHVSLIVNSLGTHKLEPETHIGWSAMGMAVEGDNITSFDYFSRLVRKAEAVATKMSVTACEFRESVVRALKHGPARSYRGSVVFAPRAVIDIFLSTVNYHLNGRSALEKTSRWSPTNIGINVMRPDFTIVDSPWNVERVGATFFDREGVPTRNQVWIDRGKLTGFLTDHYASRGLKTPASGHAAGGPSAPPSVDSHCLCLEPGNHSLVELLKDVPEKECLLVHRFSGQTDPITGDFSGVAKGAQWIVQGEVAYHVRETLISGNVFEIMYECLGLSREVETVDSAEHSPFAVFDGVSVTTPST